MVFVVALLALWLPGLASRAQAQTIIYVNAAAAPGGNGLSWATAYQDLQDAIDDARLIPEISRDVQIWVAQGTYYPSEEFIPGDPRSATFAPPVRTGIYGGFSGSETSLSQRNSALYRTVLSADLDQNDGPSFTMMENNAYFVVRILNNAASGECRLDGLIVAGANNASNPGGYSGAVFVVGGSVKLVGLTVWQNKLNAGALYSSKVSFGLDVEVEVQRTLITGNVAAINSCGIYSNGGTWIVYNSAIINNVSQGGANYAALSRDSVSLIGCTIAANSAPGGFGGVGARFDASSQLIFSDTIIWDNSNANGNGPDAQASQGGLDNCMVGSTSFGVDPLLIDLDGLDDLPGTLDDSVAISAVSPAIDAGQVTNYQYSGSDPEWLFEINNHYRIVDGNNDSTVLPDIGAFEFGSFSATVAGRLFVRPGVPGGNGSSWASPFAEVRHALTVAANINVAEIWVAAGSYKPSPPLFQGGSRSASFHLRNNLAIYGGFAGNETELAQRDIAANQTILSGDLNGDDNGDLNRSDNSYHVVNGSAVNASAVLDGFVITGGYANGPDITGLRHGGGGMVCETGSPTIRLCNFTGNIAQTGAALYLYQGSSPSVVDCQFADNHTVFFGIVAGAEGGACLVDESSAPVFRYCSFLENTAAAEAGATSVRNGSGAVFIGCDFTRNRSGTGQPERGYGGAVYASNSTVDFVHCRFHGNHAVLADGGVHSNLGDCTITGCEFVGNTASVTSGAIGQINGTLTLRGCSIVGNHVVDPSGSGGFLPFGQGAGPVLASISNSLFWANTRATFADQHAQLALIGPGSLQVSHSSVSIWTGSLGGTGNNGLDPRFRRMPSPGADGVWGTPDDDYGDLRLTNGSPAIDSGDSTAVPLDMFDIDGDGNTTESLPWDLDGLARFVDDPLVANTGFGSPPVDRGAYEFVPPIVTQPGDRRWVSPDGGDFNSLFNWFPAVPGALDNAVFDIPGAYTVSFAASPPRQTRLLTVSRGHPTFDLNGSTYSVTAPFEAAMIVGNAPGVAAELTITDGTLAPFSGLIGAENGSTGTLTVSGPGSRLLMTQGDLAVGFFGQGHMRIENGGRATNRTAGVGDQPGSQGSTVVVTGAGSRWTVPFILTINNGSVNVSDGGVLENTFGIVLFQGGSIGGNGTIIGPVINFGTVAPGNSPGTLTINGSYTQVGAIAEFGADSGRLVAQVAGPNTEDHDQLIVNGSATLGGGLFVEFTGGYAPVPNGQGEFPSFRLLESSSPLTSRFDVAFFPPVPASQGTGKYLRAVYPNRGPGAVDLVIADLGINPDFNNPDSFSIDGGPTAAAVGDLNRDGLPDLAIALPDSSDPDNNDGVVVVLFNQGVDNDGQWLGFGGATQVNVQKFPSGIAIGDFDGVSGNDLAVTNMRSDTLSILGQQAAAGTFDHALTVPTGREPTAVIAFNLDRAGRIDLAVAEGADNSVGMFANSNTPGSTNFTRTTTQPTGIRPSALRPFNPDNDKDVDVAVVNSGSSSLSVLPNLGFGTFGPSLTIPVGDEPAGLVATSLLDRGAEDIRQDLVVVNRGGGSVSVVVNTTPPDVTNALTFAPAVEYVLATADPDGARPSSLAAVDMDDDDDRDVAVLARSVDGDATVVRVLRNDLNGGEQLAFTESAQLPAGLGAVAVLSADVDGDGRQDLITVNTGPRGPGSGSVEILRNALAPPPTVCAADFDNNGQVQVADIFAFLAAWFAGQPAAMNFGGVAGVPAVFAFLTAWFAGC